jgi:DNA-binding NtrC family response regulator
MSRKITGKKPATRSGILWIQEPAVQKQLASMLQKNNFETLTALRFPELETLVQEAEGQLLLLDFAAGARLTSAERMQLVNLNCEIIILAPRLDDPEVVELTQSVQGYVFTPETSEAQIEAVIAHALRRYEMRQRLFSIEPSVRSDESLGSLVGRSPEMKDLFRLARILATRDDCVMIVGPAGSGKESLARTIHEHSRRRYAPFYSISCSSLSSTDLAVELFGADGSEPYKPSGGKSLLEMCDGGTLHLDHIDVISPSLQEKIKTYLTKEATSLHHASTSTGFDVRLIVSTETPLHEAVATGKFSEDFYFVLNRFTLFLPPLRRRSEDVSLLTRVILERIAQENHAEPLDVTEDALNRLRTYSFPGNVRELESVLEFAALVAGKGPIDVKHLPKQFQDDIGCIFVGGSVDEMPTIEEIERRYILKVMAATKGNKVKAANILEINRVTLHRKLQQYEKMKEEPVY